MDTEIKDIEQRIKERLASGSSLLFWEDEPGEYRDCLSDIDLGESASMVDATGRELATKRLVLRCEDGRQWVVYRAGGVPDPSDDFLYDIKLSSYPFTCRMEGLWADECGISPLLADVLPQHSRFFNSKDRRERLAQSGLPKGSADEVRVAMVSVCAKAKSSNPRDAVREAARRLLIEHARGNEASIKTIVECGLQGTLWSQLDTVLGYSTSEGENPTVADLALRALQTHCSALWSDGTPLLSNDAIRVLGSISSDSRNRGDFDALVQLYREPIRSLLGPEFADLDTLLQVDTLPDFDERILQVLLERMEGGALASDEAASVMEARRHTLWFDRYKFHYECIASAAALKPAMRDFYAQIACKTCAEEIFDAYCSRWYEIDLAYRKLHAARKALPDRRFRDALGITVSKLDSDYGKFLVDLTDRWQLHLLDDGSYPPAGVPAQSSFFHDKVQLAFPKAEHGRRMGVIVSDALRYEVGAELAARVNAGVLAHLPKRASAQLDSMASMLPSYTQLGMAALLPSGPMEIDPASDNVSKDGSPTNGLTNRQRIVESAMEGSVLLKAAEVLDSGVQGAERAPVVMVYHNVIDKRGDNRETEAEVFAACEQAIDEIARISTELLRAGCGKVLVTADHGFLYQAQDVEQFNYVTVEGLRDLASSDLKLMTHSRRFAVGHALPQSDMLIEYSAADLSLEGSYKVALPKGITRLRLSGSGARYVHGGASLQENAVPVVTIELKGKGAHAVQVGAQGFLRGRAVITGPTVSLDVYQTVPCSEKTAPLTVKVGLYDPTDASRLLSASEKTVELASSSESSEERKTHVTLPVVNDVDDYAKAVLRISARVGSTNQYRMEWEQELSVNRAFGNDFDF